MSIQGLASKTCFISTVVKAATAKRVTQEKKNLKSSRAQTNEKIDEGKKVKRGQRVVQALQERSTYHPVFDL
jgi:hypothetical protein